MSRKYHYILTNEQAEKAIKMCLDNAWSYLGDADIFISKNKTEHLAIPIEFAIEEIGKAKIIFDKLEKNNSINLSSDEKDGIYTHETKMKKGVSLIELDIDEKMVNGFVLGDHPIDYLLDPLVIEYNVRQEKELQDIGNQGHKIRLVSSFVDFDPVTNDPKIEKSTGDLTKLIKALYQIIAGYPSSFNTN